MAGLGPIAAGTYTTKVFETQVTYTVPDGWANYEDFPGIILDGLEVTGCSADERMANTLFFAVVTYSRSGN